MNCTINAITLLDGSTSKLGNKMLNLLNGNYAETIAYLSTANSEAFNKWFVENGGSQVTDDYDGRKVSKLISAISEYRKSFDFRINTARSSETSKLRLFPNIEHEEHAIDILTTMFLEAEDYLIANKHQAGNLKNIRAYLAKRLLDHYKTEGLTEDQLAFTKALLMDVLPVDKAGNALTSKIMASVIKNSKVVHLSRSLNLYEEANVYDEGQNNSDEAEDIEDDELKDEGSYKDWNDSSAKHVAKTISKEVRRIINTTKQLDTVEYTGDAKIFNESRNTPSGIASTLNFNDTLTNIISFGDFRNIDTFIESLHTIARSKADMMGLEVLYHKALNDKSFAIKLFVNFNQRIIKRNQLEYDSNGVKSTLANPNSNPALILRNNILSGVNRSLDLNLKPVISRLHHIKQLVDNNSIMKPTTINNVKYESGIDALCDVYGYLGLGITERGVLNYILNSSTPGTTEQKVKQLIRYANGLVSIINDAKQINEDNKTRYKDAYKNWIREKQFAEQDPQVSDKALLNSTKPNDVVRNPIISTSALHSILTISTELAKHENLKIELNSRDIQGQLVADTIKNSYLSRFFHRYQYADNAERYFKTKAQFKQYAKSNVLFEQTNSKGKIIVPGLLRLTDNGYELTEYYDFLDIELFNGAKNNSLNTSSTYAQMSDSDFDITSICEYMNDSFNNYIKTSRTGAADFKAAKYFIQTPSDAPNTYLIRSYAIALKGLNKEDNTINRSHPIYIALKNVLTQEVDDMRQAYDTIFDIDGLGRPKTKERKDNAGKRGKPIIKASLDELYDKYHYKDGKVVDSKGNLLGNVFQFWNLIVNPNSDNAMDDINKLITPTVDGMYEFLHSKDSNQLIEDYLDHYITSKTEEAVKYYDKYRPNIPNYSEELVKEMALNYTIQFINFNELFSGNPKFYKDARDTIKRNKETQAGGVPYGGYSVDNLDAASDKVITNVNVGTKEIPVTSSFKYITIFNTIKATDNIDGILATMHKDTDPAIKKLISEKYLSKTKVNDAQSYITLDEFVRRAWLSGQYEDYKDTIEALYDESKDVDASKLDKLIQVQKNFYYELQSDAVAGLEVPVQIKNAEFVLIPRFIKGTELEVLNTAMINNGIHQVNTVETEKAAMNRVMTFWDNDGNLTKANHTKFLNSIKSNTKTGYYSNLYKQQDTPQHMDAENKAGIQIVKKVVDNLNSKEGKALKQKFFDLYAANIRDSFNDITTDLNIPVDEDGNVVLDEDGKVSSLNKAKFYDMVYDELARTDANSNLLSYATLSPTGEPLMPNYVSTVRKKMMSVYQSIFTNRITRQTFAGFHAAQVSQIGFRPTTLHQSDYLKSKNVENEVNTEIARKLVYHPEGEPYIEVLLPRWAKSIYTQYNEDGSIKQEFSVDELNEAGLLDMIGYRIPTEGKQSIVVMRVVGFLDESQGSTIIVPDEFVTQTGSDFDIDSVYGIYHNFKVIKGKIQRIQYIDGTDEASVNTRYVNYVRGNISKLTKQSSDFTISDEERELIYNKLKNVINDDYRDEDAEIQSRLNEEFEEQSDIWKKLRPETQTVLKRINANTKSTNKKIPFSSVVEFRINGINKLIEDPTYAKDVDNLTNIRDAYSRMLLVMDDQQELNAVKAQGVEDNLGSIINEYLTNKIISNAQTNAEELGLMTLEEFSAQSVSEQNTREARNNAIVDTFINIMSLKETSEENLMCSNFDDIKDGKRWFFGENERWEDINSIIGQSVYRNQVMSGATLKAISVKRDTFCSVSNTAKTKVAAKHAIAVSYEYGSSPVGEYKAALKRMNDTYGIENVYHSDVTKTIMVKHDKLGWSLNGDRNAEGKLLTVYSSETTALILDGVKEGGIFNVNTYTFDVFKTFIDLGIDYKTAIAFIAQDGVSSIIAQNDAANSIYTSDRDNPIIGAMKETLIDYIKVINPNAKGINKYSKLEALYKAAGIEDTEFKDRSINKEQLKEVFHNGKQMDIRVKLLHDLSVIDNFRKYKVLSDSIGEHAGVMNLDKVGAGQSIFKARKIVNTIRDLSNRTPILETHNGTPLIKAIYPDLKCKQPVTDSVYPSLYANYKYSLVTAGKVASSIFETESRAFTNLKSILPNNVDEDTTHRFENYIISHALNNTPFVMQNVYLGKGEIIDYSNPNDTELANARRITGYNQHIVYNVDFTDPTALPNFMKLSPANKVYVLKNIVKGESLLDYLNVELADSRKISNNIPSPHTVSVMSNTVDGNKLIDLFKNMYYSEDPFVRATAQDLIRYAVVAEGFNYGFNKISNIISVETLYNEVEAGGTGLISAVNSNLEEIDRIDPYDAEELLDNFFRANIDSRYIPKYENKWSPKHKRGKIAFDNNNVAFVDTPTANSIGLVDNSYLDSVTETVVYKYKSYIKTNKFKEGVKSPELSLFKVMPVNDGVYLFPANKLEANEPRLYSVNPANNVNAASSLYERFINVSKNAIPNNFSALEKARLGITRAFIAVPNMSNVADGAGSTILGNYLNMVSNGTVTSNTTEIDPNWGQVLVSTIDFGDNERSDASLKNNLAQLAAANIKLILIDNPKTLEVVKYLETEAKYTNYQVISNSSQSDTRTYISEQNKIDAKARYMARADNYEASKTILVTDNEYYNKFVTILTNDHSVSRGPIFDADTKGRSYIAITSLVADKINLKPDNRAEIVINGKNYLVTNYGSVNKSDINTIPTYKTDFVEINKLFAGVQGDRRYINVIKVEDYDAAVEEVNESNIFESSNEDLDANINKLITDHIKGIEASTRDSDSIFGNSEFARDMKRQFKELNLNRNNKDVFNDTIRAIALTKTSLSIEQQAIYLKTKFEHFYDEPTRPNEPVSATNPLKVYKLLDADLYAKLEGNPALQQAFFKLLLDTEMFVSDNQLFSGLNKYSNEDLEAAVDDRARLALVTANASIARIKNQVNDINTLLTNSHAARDMFFNKVIAKVSTNEMVAKDLQSITQAYRDDSWFRSWATNAAESGIPLIQTVMKEVNGNVYASQMESARKVAAFKARLDAIKAVNPKAKISDLIDEQGRLVQHYTQSLIDDMRNKKQALEVTKARHGESSIEYVKAKNEYNDWLNTNIEREHDYMYYKDRSDIEHILDGYDNMRKILNVISSKQRDILNKMIGNDYSQLTEEERKQLTLLKKQRQQLRSLNYPDGSSKEGNDLDNAIAVNSYLNSLVKFKDKYQETVVKDGFAEMLKENLNVIDRLRSVKSEAELAIDSNYQDAMSFINSNTVKRTDPVLAADIFQAFKLLSTSTLASPEYKAMLEGKYDSNGVVDGSKFSESEIASLKRSQAQKFKGQHNEDVIRLLRNNTHPSLSNIIYTRGFYNSLRSDKITTDRRKVVIKAINDILLTQYVPNESRIVSHNFTIDQLDTLAKLYDELNDNPRVKNPHSGRDAAKARQRFIEHNVDFTYDYVEYEKQRIAAEANGANYYAHWIAANTEEEYDYATESFTGKILPNSELYGIAKPKDAVIDTFTDFARTNALKFLTKNVEFTPTPYYIREFDKHRRMDDASFNAWYDANHVMNPNTQIYEPLRIWQQMEVKDKTKVKYEPRDKWTSTKIRDEYKNPDYSRGSLNLNVAHADSKYMNDKYTAIMNDPIRKQLYELVNETLESVVVAEKSKGLIHKGFLPFEALSEQRNDLKSYAKAVQESIGIYDVPMKSEADDRFGKRTVSMPMLYRLNEEKTNPLPIKDDSMTDAEYADELARVYAENNKITDANDIAHRKRMNENLEDVISKFITEASRFNSIQENSKLLRLTLDELKDMKFYKLDSKGHPIIDQAKSKISGNTEYVMKDGTNGQTNFEEYMRRIIYKEFEIDEGWKTKGARVAKNFVSLRFMAGNLTSGISNVTYGETQILMEALSKEFLNVADRQKGIMDYRKGAVSYFADYDSPYSDNIQNAIIKLVDVIDLDTITEVEGNDSKVGKAYKKATTLAYLQMSVGEHFMQNSTMLGMMYSHRVVNVDGVNKLMTAEMYSRSVRENTFKEVITKYDALHGTNYVEKYDAFINKIKNDDNIELRQKYLDYKRDVVEDFLMAIPNKAKREFIDLNKVRTAEAVTIFKTYPALRDCFELKNGLATIKADSGITYKDLGNFKNKVIEVNHKIHGVYNKINSARAQSYWWGALIYHFHKHMIPGVAKRYGYVWGKGTYNEAREAVDKGSYVSLGKFLTTPFKARIKADQVTDEVNAIEGTRNILNSALEVMTCMRLYYGIMPEYDKANMRRCLGEFCAVIGSMLLYIAGRMMWDDRDKDTQLADYMMYLGDRLSSESIQYTAYGAPFEAYKLYSNPVAAFAVIKDLGKGIQAVGQYMLTGDQADLYYQTGTSYGKSKLTVNLLKQIPIYNQYMKHERLGSNNSYYKTGNNMIGVLPVRDWIDGYKDNR